MVENFIKNMINSILNDDNNIMKVIHEEMTELNVLNKFIAKFCDLEGNLIRDDPVNVEIAETIFMKVFKNIDICQTNKYYKFGTCFGEEPVSEINVKNNWKRSLILKRNIHLM